MKNQGKIKQILGKQTRIETEIKDNCRNGNFPISNCRSLAKKLKENKELIKSLKSPKKQVDRRTLLILLTILSIASIIFFSYEYKINYYPRSDKTFSKNDNTIGTSRRFIPITQMSSVALATFKTVGIKKETTLLKFDNTSGELVYVEEIKDFDYNIFYTDNDVLYFSNFRSNKEDKNSKIAIADNVKSASIEKQNNEYLISYISGNKITIKRMDSSLSNTIKEKTIKLNKKEQSSYIKIKKWKSENETKEEYIYILTSQEVESSNKIKKTQPVLRTLSNNLSIISEKLLDTGKYSLQIKMDLLPKESGIDIISGVYDPLEQQNSNHGAEIAIIKYDHDLDLYQYKLITHNGSIDDFWPNQVIQKKNITFIPEIRSSKPNLKEDKDKIYPKNTGRLLLMAIEDEKTLLGTLDILTPTPWKPGKDLRYGAKNPQMIFSNSNSVMMFYDKIIEKDVYDEGDGERRELIMRLVRYYQY